MDIGATRFSEVRKAPVKHIEVEKEIEKDNGEDVGADGRHVKLQKELKKQDRVDLKLTRAETEAELIRLLLRLRQSRTDQYDREKVGIKLENFSILL